MVTSYRLAWVNGLCWLALAGIAASGCGQDRHYGSADGAVVRPDAGGMRTDGGVVPPSDGGMMPPRDAGASGYTETICADPLPDLSALAAAYPGSGLRTAVHGIAVSRYPIAVAFIDGQTDMQLNTWYSRGSSTFADVLDGFETAAHEGAHIWDYSNSPGGMHSYRIREDLTISTRDLMNYARSEILTRHVSPSTDFYADTYLSGFSGTQGFNNLLDEYNAYTHSLAAKYCTRDSLPRGGRTSARDGILTMMYYVELYLKGARLDHPDDYAEIMADPQHANLILTIWARAEFYLALTASHTELGINDSTIHGWTYAPDNVAEIDMLR